MEAGDGGDAGSEASYESVASEGAFEPASDRGRDPLPRIISASHCVQVFQRVELVDGTFCCRAESSDDSKTDPKALRPHNPTASLPDRLLRFDGAMEAWLEEVPLPRDPHLLRSPFSSLNDAANFPAAPGRPDMTLLQLGNQRATIWYFTLEFLQQLWPLFLNKDDAGLKLWQSALLDRGCTIQSTHVEVGRVNYAAKTGKQRTTWLKALFSAMQASSWSPNGEARAILAKRRLTHVSMSIGDAVQIGHELYVAGLTGFVAVGEAAAVLPPSTEPEIAEPAEQQAKARPKKKAAGSEGEADAEDDKTPPPPMKDKGKGKGKKGRKEGQGKDGANDAEGANAGKKKGKGKGKGKGAGGDDGEKSSKAKKGRQKEEKGAGPDRVDRRALRSQLQAERDKAQGQLHSAR